MTAVLTVAVRMDGTTKRPTGQTTELEFGGVIGTSLMVFTLPLAVFLINLACSTVGRNILVRLGKGNSIPGSCCIYFSKVKLSW